MKKVTEKYRDLCDHLWTRSGHGMVLQQRCAEGRKEIKTSTMIHYLQDKKVESINVTETKMTAELNNGKLCMPTSTAPWI